MNKGILGFLALYLFIFVFPAWALATPDIEVVSGVVSKGNNITIQGSGFGSKSTAAPLKFDDFEQTGNEYEDGDSLANGWLQWYSFGQSEYETSNTRLGSSKHALSDFTSDTHRTFIYDHGSETLTPVYITFWVRYNSISEGSAPQVKWLRVMHSTTNGDFDSVVTNIIQWSGMTSSQINVRRENVTYASPGSSGRHTPREDVWIREEHYYVESSGVNQADGELHVWMQNAEGSKFSHEINETSVTTNTGTNRWRYVMFSEYKKDWTGTFEFDDIYIDNTLARIEIGDNATWENCTHREIQIPTTWSDSSISITVNQGSFIEGSNAYLFVVDADGAVSNGYQITIGDGSVSDNNPPGDITGFTAQPGDSQIVLSWLNPTDSDFVGTLIRYSMGDDPYPATHNEGVFVCDRETSPGSSDSFTVIDLDNNTKYNFSAFTYDEAGNYSETAHVSAIPTGSGPPSDTTDPTIGIMLPTSEDSYLTGGYSVELAGTASDNVGIVSVTWSNSRGGSGIATGTTNWLIYALPLQCGNDNIINVTAKDAAGNSASDILTIDVPPCSPSIPLLE